MISSAWKTITGNFKEVFSIVKPVLILSLIAVVLKFANQYLGHMGVISIKTSVIITIIVAISTIILSFMVGFIYWPAAFRTFQKKEFGETTTLAENIAFTKTHKWEFFSVMLWSSLLSFIYLIGSIIPAVLGIWVATLMKDTNLIVGILIAVAGGIVTVYFLFKTIPKFVFPINVYFATGKKSREAVKESMRLGTMYSADTYALFGKLIVVTLGLLLVEGLVIGLLLLPEYITIFSQKSDFVTMTMTASTSMEWRALIASLITTALDTLIMFPLSVILTAKAYVAIKAKDDAITSVVDMPVQDTANTTK